MLTETEPPLVEVSAVDAVRDDLHFGRWAERRTSARSAGLRTTTRGRSAGRPLYQKKGSRSGAHVSPLRLWANPPTRARREKRQEAGRKRRGKLSIHRS